MCECHWADNMFPAWVHMTIIYIMQTRVLSTWLIFVIYVLIIRLNSILLMNENKSNLILNVEESQRSRQHNRWIFTHAVSFREHVLSSVLNISIANLISLVLWQRLLCVWLTGSSEAWQSWWDQRCCVWGGSDQLQQAICEYSPVFGTMWTISNFPHNQLL